MENGNIVVVRTYLAAIERFDVEAVAHICMAFTLRDGRIVVQKNYDCYEDFVAA